MTTYSWFLNPHIPGDSKYLATQSTKFGCSSLALSSTNMLAIDDGRQIYTTSRSTAGNGKDHSTTIYSTDKSALGVEWYKHAKTANFKVKEPRTVTVPNIYSLRRDTLL